MSTLKEKLEILVTEGSGRESDLLKKMPIGALQELELVGYISRGVTRSGENVWSVSEEAKEDYRIYCAPPSLGKKILGFFMYCFGLRVQI